MKAEMKAKIKAAEIPNSITVGFQSHDKDGKLG